MYISIAQFPQVLIIFLFSYLCFNPAKRNNDGYNQSLSNNDSAAHHTQQRVAARASIGSGAGVGCVSASQS